MGSDSDKDGVCTRYDQLAMRHVHIEDDMDSNAWGCTAFDISPPSEPQVQPARQHAVP